MKPNGIGMFLAILVGIGVFAGWVGVCYPAVATELLGSARSSSSWLVLIGFVVLAVMGCTMAAQLLHNLLLVLRSIVQVAVILVVVVGGVLLWRHNTVSDSSETASTPVSVSPEIPLLEEPAPSTSRSGFWWEQSKEK